MQTNREPWTGASTRWGWMLMLVTLALVPTLSWAQAAAGKRVALVVGNAAYADAPLKNPVNDAQDLSVKLSGLGFEVTMLTNRNRAQLTAAIRDFGRSAAGADAALFYFAGHGVQVKGRNFLLPVGQRFADEAEVETDAVDVGSVLGRMEEAGAKVSLLILDACRTNPLQRSGRSGTRGLARMDAPSGALVAFAAQPGAEAQDGDGRNGVFTRHLLAHIGTPGMAVEQMFKKVRSEVERETGRRQSPREESSLTADFYFANPFGRTNPAEQARLEEESWALCRGASTVGPCEEYLKLWSPGKYAGLARTKLKELQALEQRRSRPLQPSPSAPLAAVRNGQVIRDCSECPDVVVLPAGQFMMGSPANEAGRYAFEGPVHLVTIGYRFAIGRTEVTRGQFGRFVQASGYRADTERKEFGAQGCFTLENPVSSKLTESSYMQGGKSWRDPGFEQGDEHPVVCVTWNDAQAYVKWLNEKAPGKGYRLPSEAEWEYAARGGTTTRYWWGDTASHEYANFGKDQCCGGLATGRDRWVNTAPVGQVPANAFGLHDMHGNVWEWTQDVWHDSYAAGPTDGAAWTTGGDQARRVLRGGSWNDAPRVLRSASRNGDSPDYRSNYAGFRIARTF